MLMLLGVRKINRLFFYVGFFVHPGSRHRSYKTLFHRLPCSWPDLFFKDRSNRISEPFRKKTEVQQQSPSRPDSKDQKQQSAHSPRMIAMTLGLCIIFLYRLVKHLNELGCSSVSMAGHRKTLRNATPALKPLISLAPPVSTSPSQSLRLHFLASDSRFLNAARASKPAPTPPPHTHHHHLPTPSPPTMHPVSNTCHPSQLITDPVSLS